MIMSDEAHEYTSNLGLHAMIKMVGVFPETLSEEVRPCVFLMLNNKIGIYETRSPGWPENVRRHNDREDISVDMQGL